MSLNAGTFSDVEELGFRLRAVRLYRGMSVAAVRGDRMTHIAYARSEEGHGSLQNLTEIAEILELEIKTEVNGQVIPFNQLHETIVSLRGDKSVADVSRAMESTYASVKVFEQAGRPRIQSIGRYMRALNMVSGFQVIDKEGTVINPAKITPTAILVKLQSDLSEILNKGNDTVENNGIGTKIKNLRESLSYSKADVARLSNMTQASIANVERSSALLTTSEKVIESMDRTLEVSVDGEVVKASYLQVHLDKIRQARGISVSEFANKVSATYRTVKIFPTSVPNPSSVQRYANGLGVNIELTIR